MIKKFKDNEVRATGIINRGMFEQVKMLYLQDPAAGGELAVSLMEQVLTGDHSSDDFMVKFAIANHQETIARSQERYDASKEARHDAVEAGLREIADMLKSGMKQVDIARKLNISTSNLSKKVSKIRKEFPSLLELETSCQVSKVSGNLESLETLEKVSELPKNGNLEILETSITGKSCQVSKKEETLETSAKVSELPSFQNEEKMETFLETSSDLEIVSKFPSFQNFQHKNGNGNVNGNNNGQGNSRSKAGVKFEF